MRLLTNWLAIKPNKMVSKAVVKRNIVEFGKINRPSCQMPNPHARAPEAAAVSIRCGRSKPREYMARNRDFHVLDAEIRKVAEGDHLKRPITRGGVQ